MGTTEVPIDGDEGEAPDGLTNGWTERWVGFNEIEGEGVSSVE